MSQVEEMSQQEAWHQVEEGYVRGSAHGSGIRSIIWKLTQSLPLWQGSAKQLLISTNSQQRVLVEVL